MNNRFPIKIGPGIVTDETVTAINTGNWADASLVRFWRGLPQTINGWEANTSDTFSGICRGLFAWRDNAGLLNIAIGTHTGLYVWNDGTVYNITPATEALLLEDDTELLLEDDTSLLLESSFFAGNENGYGGAGYGIGPYGTGDYGEPSDLDSFPLTWSFDSFGQNLIPDDLQRAFTAAERCDVLLAVGSTLSVYPIAQMVPIARNAGADIVIVNGERTELDSLASVVVNADLNEALPLICGGGAPLPG